MAELFTIANFGRPLSEEDPARAGGSLSAL